MKQYENLHHGEDCGWVGLGVLSLTASFACCDTDSCPKKRYMMNSIESVMHLMDISIENGTHYEVCYGAPLFQSTSLGERFGQ